MAIIWWSAIHDTRWWAGRGRGVLPVVCLRQPGQFPKALESWRGGLGAGVTGLWTIVIRITTTVIIRAGRQLPAWPNRGLGCFNLAGGWPTNGSGRPGSGVQTTWVARHIISTTYKQGDWTPDDHPSLPGSGSPGAWLQVRSHSCGGLLRPGSRGQAINYKRPEYGHRTSEGQSIRVMAGQAGGGDWSARARRQVSPLLGLSPNVARHTARTTSVPTNANEAMQAMPVLGTATNMAAEG